MTPMLNTLRDIWGQSLTYLRLLSRNQKWKCHKNGSYREVSSRSILLSNLVDIGRRFMALQYVVLFAKFPQYEFYGKIGENVNFDNDFLKLCNTDFRHFSASAKLRKLYRLLK